MDKYQVWALGNLNMGIPKYHHFILQMHIFSHKPFKIGFPCKIIKVLNIFLGKLFYNWVICKERAQDEVANALC